MSQQGPPPQPSPPPQSGGQPPGPYGGTPPGQYPQFSGRYPPSGGYGGQYPVSAAPVAGMPGTGMPPSDIPPKRNGGTIAAISGVALLVATVSILYFTGTLGLPSSEEAKPQPSDSAADSEPAATGGKYRTIVNLCGNLDLSVVESVAPMADDIDALNSESEADKTVTTECSALLDGHQASQFYVNVTTLPSPEEAAAAHDMVAGQQQDRVESVTEVDGDWDHAQMGVGMADYELYVDLLFQDANLAGSVVIALQGDSLTDAAVQEEAAQTANAAIVAEIMELMAQ